MRQIIGRILMWFIKSTENKELIRNIDNYGRPSDNSQLNIAQVQGEQ